MGGSSQQRELENEVRKLYLLMQSASEQAIISNQVLGLKLENDGYQFMAYREQTGDWTASGGRIFRARGFPDWLTVTKFIENAAQSRSSSADDLRPDVRFNPIGEITAFEFEFTIGNGSDNMHVLASDGASPIEWRKPGEEGSSR